MSDYEGIRLKYFVLKPEGNTQYAKASRAAMRTYAWMIESEDPDLSAALYAWTDRTEEPTI